MVPLVERVLNTIEKCRLILPGESVLVGVSGGADSIALLDILVQLRARLDFKVVAAHLNHGLRDAEARQDCRFVADVSKAYGVEFVSDRRDVRLVCEREGLSLEDAARRVRYGFLEETAAIVRARKVAVGHTLNDQVETILFRILRGSGPDGLEGMRLSRPLGESMLVRPLLGVARSDVLAHLKSRSLAWREDASNSSSDFARNKIRHVLIPLLENEFQSMISKHLIAMSSILGAENRWLEKQTGQRIARMVKQKGESLCLDLDAFCGEDVAIQRRLLRRLYECFHRGGNFSFNHMNRILAFIETAHSGRELDLPGGIKVWIEFRKLYMGKGKTYGILEPRILAVPGEIFFAGGKCRMKIAARRLPRGNYHPSRKANFAFSHIWNSLLQGKTYEISEYFDSGTVGAEILVRSRRSGDFYDPLGLGGRKSVKDIYLDEKVEASFRSEIPVFESNGRIFWIGGYRISESFKVRPETRELMEISLIIEGGQHA